jgi:hypothetical protein
VPSLLARSRLRPSRPLFFLSKLASLSAFVILMCIGWIGFSYLKSDLASRSAGGAPQVQASPGHAVESTAVRLSSAAVETKAPANPVRLVYSCKSDKEHYHTSTHLPAGCEPSALGEEAALQRGLKPCSTCLR